MMNCHVEGFHNADEYIVARCELCVFEETPGPTQLCVISVVSVVRCSIASQVIELSFAVSDSGIEILLNFTDLLL